MPPVVDGVDLILKKADKVFVALNGKIQHELSLKINFLKWLK